MKTRQRKKIRKKHGKVNSKLLYRVPQIVRAYQLRNWGVNTFWIAPSGEWVPYSVGYSDGKGGT